MAIVLYLVLALIGGAVIPFQAGINAQLAQLVHGPIRAALVSFLVGTVVLLVAAAVVPKPWPLTRPHRRSRLLVRRRPARAHI